MLVFTHLTRKATPVLADSLWDGETRDSQCGVVKVQRSLVRLCDSRNSGICASPARQAGEQAAYAIEYGWRLKDVSCGFLQVFCFTTGQCLDLDIVDRLGTARWKHPVLLHRTKLRMRHPTSFGMRV